MLLINGMPAMMLPNRVVTKPILVVGGPRDDEERNEIFYMLDDRLGITTMAVNNTFEWLFADWDYVCTLDSHETSLGKYYRLEMIPEKTIVIGKDTGAVHKRIDRVLDVDCQGTSGLFALITAVWMGFSPVYSLGLYIDEPPYNGPNSLAQWRRWQPFLKGHVKSVSKRGLVAEMFGVVDEIL